MRKAGLTTDRPSRFVRRAPAAAIGVGAALIALAPGCGAPDTRARKPDTIIVRDTPEILRDTIGAQTTVQGMDEILVSGYGLVVGLNGTGGGDVPSAVRAVMEREMTLMGVGKEIGPFRNVTPGELLADRNTAVVIVSAMIPPGSPVGTRFDVVVESLPGSATSSLEGGRLYTTRLFRGMIRPAAPATQPHAEAKGQIFINPFADPAQHGQDSVNRTEGRVLNGGSVIGSSRVVLNLDAPSHTRSRAIAEAINNRFQRARGEADAARGMSEDLVELDIPSAWRNEPDRFISLVRHTRVNQSFPVQAAEQFARGLVDAPELSNELSLCLQALGPVAIPAVRRLYEHPELRPRLAAVEAGAALGDLAARPYLEEMASTGAPALRAKSIRLMGGLGQDPKIDMFLRDLVSAPEVDIRIAAYEALDKRGDPWVERRAMGDKFVLHSVPSSQPMVYVTLQRVPKIVVFGAGLEVRRPVFATAWGDRLMISAQTESDPRIRVYYRDFRSGNATTAEVQPGVADLVEYFAHKTTPEEPAPGLDLSYSEVVGALAQILKAGGIGAMFVPETDRLALDLIRSRQFDSDDERPELMTDKDNAAETEASPEREETIKPATDSKPPAAAEPAPPAKKQYVVPVAPPAAPAKPKS